MDRLAQLSEQFKTKYEKFIIACDSVEENTLWDKDAFGEMDVFYENDIVSVIISLIASDGKVSMKEVCCLNDLFGFSYDLDSLTDVYNNCTDEIDSYFDDKTKSGISFLSSVNEKLASLYRELLALVCDIIAESDGNISPEESELLTRFKATL